MRERHGITFPIPFWFPFWLRPNPLYGYVGVCMHKSVHYFIACASASRYSAASPTRQDLNLEVPYIKYIWPYVQHIVYMAMFKYVCTTLPYWTRHTLKNWNGNTFWELGASYCLQIWIDLFFKKWHRHSFVRLEWAYVLRTGIAVDL